MFVDIRLLDEIENDVDGGRVFALQRFDWPFAPYEGMELFVGDDLIARIDEVLFDPVSGVFDCLGGTDGDCWPEAAGRVRSRGRARRSGDGKARGPQVQEAEGVRREPPAGTEASGATGGRDRGEA